LFSSDEISPTGRNVSRFAHWIRPASVLERLNKTTSRDPEKWVPVFGQDHAQRNKQGEP
jgi:hypothetical protein